MTTPAPLDLPTLLDDLKRAHERWRAGGFDGFTAMLDLAAAVPTLIAELRKRDAALRAVLDKCDRMEREAREDHTGDPNDAATVRANALHFAAHNLRAALTAALSPESVQS